MRPTIVNFVESSRFTEAQRIKTQSPYRNLLAPKAAGIAFTLSTLGNQFEKRLTVTLVYPDNQDHPFMDMLCGRLKRVVVKIECLPIGDELREDYFYNKTFKRQFQLWLNTLWQDKDHTIDGLKRKYRKKNAGLTGVDYASGYFCSVRYFTTSANCFT